jgi:TolB-like protein/Tfp pilus assembly protein PilF
MILEIRRRRIFRIVGIYIVGAWVALQAADLALESLGFPNTALRFIWVAAFAGFPIALVFGWRYDITPDGIVRTPPAEHAVAAEISLRWQDFLILGALGVMAIVAIYSTLNEISGTAPTDVTYANSLVVLPFSNLTSDEEFSWFSDGLTETLSQALTRVNGLRVIGRASANRFRDSEEALKSIAAQLNVAHAIRGSVQKDDAALRITASLIRVDDQYVLWSDTYDRNLDEIFEVQDDITSSIVRRMEVVLAKDLAVPTESGRSLDPEAYQIILRAHQLRSQRTKTSLAASDEMYREALSIEPNSKEALLGLSGTITQRATMGFLPREQSYSDAVALIHQALAIDENDAAAYLDLAEIQHRHFWNFDEARANYEKAMTLNDGDANTRSAYARFLSHVGEFDGALKEARIARELNPLSSSANSSLVLRLIRAGGLEEAAEILAEMHKQFPENGDLPWLNAMWQMKNRAYQDVLSWISQEEFDYLRLSISAIAYHHLGRTVQAVRALEELIATDAEGAAFQIAEVFAQRGMPDDAFLWLDRALAAGDPGLAELLSAETLIPLYDDPRFNELLTKVGLPTIARR